jgi:flagellar basal-body rod protein FlgB
MTGMISQHNLLADSLAGIEQNHRVISQNIANANTPGYRAQTLDFAEFLKRIEQGTTDAKVSDNIPVHDMQGLSPRKDGNNVDLDGQVGALKKNALMFQTISQLLASKMALARRAMSR